MNVRNVITMLLACALVFAGISSADAVAVKDDPLVRMPGTQPAPENSPDIEAPGRCMNCHGGYDSAVEPAFNWQGSMMAQAARDFLFFACMTTAAQDSIWAVGRPNATDICLRCHFPKGWLEGRSDPTNGSAMTGNDFDGVQCDFCHSMFDPFFEETYNGIDGVYREGKDWLDYWDETNASDTPSQPAADLTYADDARLAQDILLFGGGNFFTNNLPPAGYTENGSGQYFVDDNRAKRASFADADARHNIYYSRHHKSKYFCASCHDVSNPILANLMNSMGGNPDPAAATLPLHTETNSAFSYYHVERTFSEFMLSDYGLQGGAPTNPEFQAQGAPDITHAAKCQDCHMRDGTGKACSQNSGVNRPTDSIEHPQSGQPIHDLTGGNAWVSWVLASAVSGSPNHDPHNDALLNQGAGLLTLDLNQGEGIDPVRLLAGVDRAMQQLQLAATIKNISYNASNGSLSFTLQNNTGHKLISGFPEGRRMFVNIRACSSDPCDGNNTIYEVNPYDTLAGTLKGLHYNYQPDPLEIVTPAPDPLGPNEVYVDELVYETHPSSSLTGEHETFHFALATDRYKDNRIPPKGFRIADAAERLSIPRWHGDPAPNYFTAEEYAGGYDDVSVSIAPNAAVVEINLFYQTTSREYIEFLRDEINGNPGNLTLPDPDPNTQINEAYIVQSDPWFGQLAAWGDTIWDLWTHNRDVTTAAPYLMTQAFAVGAAPCTPPVPTLSSAVPASQQVALEWSDEHSADPAVHGYNLYYDQAGKAQLVAQLGNVIMYTDTGLTNNTEYCYKVTSFYDCDEDLTPETESGFSNILCATPKGAGQEATSTVDTLDTGVWAGRKNPTFQIQTSFTAGDKVVFQAHVADVNTTLDLEGATVTLSITGQETRTVAATSDVNGNAYGEWQTQKSSKKRPGTTPGTYTATVTNVEGPTGYTWDGVMTSTSFTIQ